ncbi:MAG TPA: hypothetical protein VF086_11775 [Propionibacteriaceae bacterium]
MHSALMVIAGVLVGIAVIRAAVFPRWTGIALISGMVFMANATVLPEVAQTAAAGIRDLAFAGMGAALLLQQDGRAYGVWRSNSSSNIFQP